MNKISMFMFIVIISSISGCAETIDILYAANRTDIESYDDNVCEYGEPSLPGQPVRYGCVNNKTKLENRVDFLEYQKERDQYLKDN